MEIEETCPICKRSCENIPFQGRDARSIKCISCGVFDITWTAIQTLINNRLLTDIKRKALSHWLFSTTQKSNNIFMVTSEVLNKIIPEIKLPSANEQFSNLIKYLGDTAQSPEELIDISNETLPSIIGSNGMSGANYVLNYLIKKDLIYKSETTSSSVKLIMNPEGWTKYGELIEGDTNSKQVFMAMEYENEILDNAYNHFKQAIGETGFELKILNETLKAGLIDDQLRVKIRQSKFILSDLSFQNAGAYWEAGYAEGLGKQVIYLCEKSHWEKFKTHFDTNHHTTIVWALDTIVEDMKKLKATVRASFPAEATMEND